MMPYVRSTREGNRYIGLTRGITSLPDLTDREIGEGHNLEKLLRGGEFDEQRGCRP